MSEMTARIKSPCRSICQVDGRAKICIGCGRSLKEVAAWGRMSEAEQLTIMAELPARLANFEKTYPKKTLF